MLEFLDKVYLGAASPDSGGVTPTGELSITANGNYDVTEYATVDVNVPQPSGTININENGTYNVKDYETAKVSTPQPSGSINITENGTYDVTDYAEANVEIESDVSDKCIVRVIDYDGSVIEESYVDKFTTYTLPSNPVHNGLTFQEWSCPLEVTTNKIDVQDFDITVGAVYTTTSGESEFDIEVNTQQGYTTFALNMDGTKDWGDGTTDTNTTHTYTTSGLYTVSCNGTTLTASSSSNLFSGSSDSRMIRAARLANVTSIPAGCFRGVQSIKYVTFPQGITTIGEGTFFDCYHLTHIIFPSTTTELQTTETFCFAFGLKDVVLNYGMTTLCQKFLWHAYGVTKLVIPATVTIANQALYGATGLKYLAFCNYCITNSSVGIKEVCYQNFGIDTIIVGGKQGETSTLSGGYLFSSSGTYLREFSINIPTSSLVSMSSYINYSIKKITVGDNVTGIGSVAFSKLEALEEVVLGKNVKTISGSAFEEDVSLTQIDLTNVETIGNNAFYDCYALKYAAFKDIQSIGSTAFYRVAAIFDFSQCSSVPTIASNTFTKTSYLKILVPQSLYSTWIASGNWVTFADYIEAV